MLRIEIMSRPQVCLLRVTDVNEAVVDLVLMQPFSTLFATLHFHNTPYLPPNVLHKHCFQFLLGFTRGNIVVYLQLHSVFGPNFLADKIGIVFENKNCIVPISVWKTFILTGN